MPVCFAAKRTAFCGKTRCILRQNALYFAAKRMVFCRKTDGRFAAKHSIVLPQNGKTNERNMRMKDKKMTFFMAN